MEHISPSSKYNMKTKSSASAVPTIKILRNDSKDRSSEMKQKSSVQVSTKPKPSDLCISFDTLLKDSASANNPVLSFKKKQTKAKDSLFSSTKSAFQNDVGDFPVLSSPSNLLQTNQPSAIRHDKPKDQRAVLNNTVERNHSLDNKMQRQNSMILNKKTDDRTSKPATSTKVSNKVHKTHFSSFYHPSNNAAQQSSEDMNNRATLSQDRQSLAGGEGRQRPVSKKKKLTALKKQVLLQRLERWNQSQVDKTKLEYQPKSLENEDTLVLQILNYITDYDCIQDEDEYNECVSDLMDLATKIGPVKDSLIPIFNSSEKGVFVLFHHFNDALAARACWNKLVLSGQRLDVSIISKDAMIRKGMEYTQGNSEDQNLDWKQSVLRLDATHLASLRLPIQDLNTSNNSTTGQSIDFTLLLDNILSQEDFDDEECLAESISDIIELVEKYGPVVKERTCVDRSGINQGQVQIVIQGERLLLRSAVEEINGLILGGRKVSARLVDPAVDISSIEKTRPSSVLILSDILGEDEFEDKECLEETRRDIHALVAAYGRVEYMDVKLHGDEAGQVHVSYIEGDGAVQSAVKGLDGTILGGCAIKATCRIMDDEGSRIQPIMSGDKVIPKKYAECKRVPKIPFSDPSDYVVRRNDDSTQILLTEMLGELMRLQISSQDDQRHNRAHDDSPVKIRRRLVMGFREVARGLRAHNVKMVILAYNCDQYDAVDDKVQDILHLAKDQEIPVFFDLSKKKIGKALGKSIKVSVVGINNADGAHAQFKSLKKCANTYPISSDNGVTMDMTPRGR